MTIRINTACQALEIICAESEHGAEYCIVSARGNEVLATADTPAEAETARLAFERVLLPRFTADEAIAAVKGAFAAHWDRGDLRSQSSFRLGMRATLEALAAAGVFVPDGAHVCPVHSTQGRCKHVPQTMADKLNAAGVK